MKVFSIIGCVLAAIIGLIAMCLCSIIFPSVWGGLINFVVFICFSGIIAALILGRNSSRRSKVTALCIFIGLVGIAVMQFCSLIILPPFSGFVGIAVFFIFAAIITVIIINQKKFFNSEYQDFMKNHCKKDAAARLVWTLRERGVSDTEIRRIIKEKFQYSDSEMTELFYGAK